MKRNVSFLLIFLLSMGFCFAEESIDKNAIKFTFLSWSSGSTKISYERAFPKINQSGEICVGLISAGYDKYQNHPRGFTVRYGHKFFLGNFDKAKPFDGFFLRPEYIFSRFTYDKKKSENTRALAQMNSLIGCFGYQKTFGKFIVDSWVGAGVAFGDPCETGYHHGFQLWDFLGSKNENIALSFSIRLGWIF